MSKKLNQPCKNNKCPSARDVDHEYCQYHRCNQKTCKNQRSKENKYCGRCKRPCSIATCTGTCSGTTEHCSLHYPSKCGNCLKITYVDRQTTKIDLPCPEHKCIEKDCQEASKYTDKRCGDHTNMICKGRCLTMFGESTYGCRQIALAGQNYCSEHVCKMKSCQGVCFSETYTGWYGPANLFSNYCLDHKCTEIYCVGPRLEGNLVCQKHKCQYANCSKSICNDYNQLSRYCIDHNCGFMTFITSGLGSHTKCCYSSVGPGMKSCEYHRCSFVDEQQRCTERVKTYSQRTFNGSEVIAHRFCRLHSCKHIDSCENSRGSEDRCVNHKQLCRYVSYTTKDGTKVCFFNAEPSSNYCLRHGSSSDSENETDAESDKNQNDSDSD
jgi:hypothetical protein